MDGDVCCTRGTEDEASLHAGRGRRSVSTRQARETKRPAFTPLSIGDPSDLRGTFHNKLAERQGIYEPSGYEPNSLPKDLPKNLRKKTWGTTVDTVYERPMTT